MTSLTQFVYRAKLEKTTSNRYRDFVTTVDFCRLFPDILFNALLYLMHQPSITRHHSAPLFEACARMRALRGARKSARIRPRSEEHTSELQSLMRISYAVFCLKKKNKKKSNIINRTHTNNESHQPHHTSS